MCIRDSIHVEDKEFELHRQLHKKGVRCPSFLVSAMKAQRQSTGMFGNATLATLVTDTVTPLDPNSIPYNEVRGYYKQLFAYAPEYYAEFEKVITDYGL